nr:hypothetical protein Iba_chr04bCG3600 [Ipomoea batatas]GMC83669.1 hypothetical protein Iba_chr04cCG4270 [Ipomoea batatas]
MKWRSTFATPFTFVSITLSKSSAGTSQSLLFLLMVPALLTTKEGMLFFSITACANSSTLLFDLYKAFMMRCLIWEEDVELEADASSA